MSHKPKCPRCGSGMKRLYERHENPGSGKREWLGVGWRCENPTCCQIVGDVGY